MIRLAALSTIYACLSGIFAGLSWGFAAQARQILAVAAGMISGFVCAFAVAHITAIADTIARRRSP